MTAVQARILALILVLVGVGWTVYSRIHHDHELFTTSRRISGLAQACPQIRVLIVVIAVLILQDMLPDVNRWVVFLIFACIYCLGHCLWPL